MPSPLTAILFFVASATLPAQCLADPDLAQVKAHMEFLCSDECAGRATGSEGERIAGNRIAEHFQSLGLEPMQGSANNVPSPYHHGWPYSRQEESTLPNAGTAYNIGAVLPGTDPALKHEYIFLIAHYDHMGKKGNNIYRGAGDNAAGTACIMDLARIFKEKPARRSIAFLALSGEERGLLGSKAYVKNPAIPLNAIKGLINLDMVGRNDETYLNIIISKTDKLVSTLTSDGRDMCLKHGITPSAGPEKYAKAGGDSATFALKGIPCLWFDCGMFPDYHRTTDTVDKINFPKVERTIKITRDLADKIANDDQAPVFLPKSEWSQWKWAPNMEKDRNIVKLRP